MEVDRSDLEKVHDCLMATDEFLIRRDQMNAVLHLARETRSSPLRSLVSAELDRVKRILTANTEDILDA